MGYKCKKQGLIHRIVWNKFMGNKCPWGGDAIFKINHMFLSFSSDKAYKEIDDVIGSAHSISYQDKKKLPYINAVIHETQRFKYALLFGVVRQCTEDVKICGFLIPKV